MEVKYILEFVVGGEAKAAITLPLVNSLTVRRIPTDDITWTLGNEPIREHNGIREYALALAGHSGMAFRNGFDNQGQRLFADGPKLFREFEKFLLNYSQQAKDNQQSGASLKNPTRLVFRALWEELSIHVEQSDFTWNRAVEIGPFNYTWSLDLRGYGLTDRGVVFNKNVFELFADTSRQAARTIDSATSYSAVAIEQLESIRGKLDAVREPIRAVGRMAREASRVASAAQGLRSWPHDLVADLFSTANAATFAVFDHWANKPFIDRQSVRSVMLDVLGPMAELRRESLTWLGLNFIDVRGLEDPTVGSVSYTSSLRSQVVGTRPAVPFTVSQGQDIGDLAQIVLGDRDQWKVISRLNGVADPHATPEGRPFGPGEVILVPSTTPTGGVSSSDPSDVYGTDLMLGPDGDLVLSGTEDIALISGRPNLNQALTLRATTVQGTNAVFTDIGLPATVGGSIYAETAGLLASQGRSQFAADPRIEEVTELEVDDSGGDRLIMTALLKPVADAPFRVAVPISQGI